MPPEECKLNLDLRVGCIILTLKEGLMCDKDTLNLITEKVCAAAKEVLGDRLEKVVLFGSYARGDYHEWSDSDIMILADIQPEDVDETRKKTRSLMNYIELEYDAIVSLSVVCRKNYYKYINVLPFYMNVQKEGVELYA
jgi:predicted nucleotidyltransferase